jgi:hypothetical protein
VISAILVSLLLAVGLIQAGPSLIEVPLDARTLPVLKHRDFAPLALMDRLVIVETDASGMIRLERNGIRYRALLDAAANDERRTTKRELYLVTPPDMTKVQRDRQILADGGQILTEDETSYLLLTTREFAERLPTGGYEIARVSPQGAVLPDDLGAVEPHAPSAGRLAYNPVIDTIINRITPTEVAAFIRQLSGEVPVTVRSRLDTIRTRYTSTAKNSSAIWYLYEKYQTLGLDSVKFHPYGSDSNVIATKVGTTYPGKYWIIGGHLDNTSETPTTYAPGANDNGTGTIMALIAAKYLAPYRFKYTIRFMGWNGEEQGLLGSDAHARQARTRGDSIKGVLNGDMIATDTSGKDSVRIYNANRAGAITISDTFKRCNTVYGIGLRPGVFTTTITGSDHYSYHQQGYSAILAIESDFSPVYHTTNDRITYAKFDTVFYCKVVRCMAATLATLAELELPANDVGVTKITAPAGTIDSGIALAPACTVYNFGSTMASYQVRMKIGSGYDRTASVSGHAPGTRASVTFPNWTAGARGSYAVSCSTELTGDAINSNDKATGTVVVQVTDVGTTRLLAPSGTLIEGTPVTPACSVYNFGDQAESYPVRMKIGTVYSNTAQVAGHAAGARLYVTFPSWTASVGTHAVTCSTELSGDAQPNNNKATTSVTVNPLMTNDVGVTHLLAPAGACDSGATVAPACSVYNYGTASPSYYVRMRIGGSYDYTSAQVVSHPPSQRRYVTFPAWTALARGPATVTCTTELTGDIVPENDKQGGSVFVRAHDAGTVAIVAPTGSLDSTAALTPSASVHNYGNVDETFEIEFKIGSAYDQTITRTVAAGGESTFTFADWTPLVRGHHDVQCSTRLATDGNRANDRALTSVDVLVHDVAAIAITEPVGTIPPSSVAPKAVVKRLGTLPREAVDVTFTINSSPLYQATVGLPDGLPDVDTVIEFLPWDATVGSYTAQCSTYLSTDQVHANDVAASDFSVSTGLIDAGVLQIIRPTGTLFPSDPVLPRAYVKNFGAAPATFRAFFLIDNGADLVVYRESTTIADLAAGDSTVAAFMEWPMPHDPGGYTTRCSTYIAGDNNHANDAQGGSFTLIAGAPAPDVGVARIITPTGPLDSADAILPSAYVKNYGATTATFMAYFLIDNGAEAVVYSESASVSGLAGGDSVIAPFPAWPKPHAVGSYTTRCSTYIAGDANHANDARGGSFTIQAGGGPSEGWSQKADVPTGGKNKRVKDGACEAYSEGTDADSSYIYALKGNNTVEFYRYSIESNTWVARESIPAIGSSGKKKRVKKGASLAGTGDMFYATKGNNTLEFWKYEPGADAYAWQQKADVPTGAKNVKEGAGAVTVTLGETMYVYLLKGSGTQEFYRFNPITNVWLTRTTAPAGLSGKPFKNGSALALGEDGRTIYAVKGSYNEFFSYSVDSNFWTTKAALPLIGSSGKKKKVKDGAGIAYHAGNVYALKGGNTQEFWNYSVESNKWVQKPDIPIGGGKRVKGGGALVYAPSATALFAFKGNNTLEYWKYQLSGKCEVRSMNYEVQSSSFIPHNSDFRLQIAPNPFTSAATITYSLLKAGNMTLKLYDVTGTLVTTLVQGYHTAGSSSFTIHRSSLACGIYLLKLETETATTTSKLIIE